MNHALEGGLIGSSFSPSVQQRAAYVSIVKMMILTLRAKNSSIVISTACIFLPPTVELVLPSVVVRVLVDVSNVHTFGPSFETPGQDVLRSV